MAVQWDAVLAREVARELDTRLRGTRLRGVAFDGDHRRLTLFTDDACLEWRLHPNEGEVRLFEPRPIFETAMRVKAKIIGFRAPRDERRIEAILRPAKGSSSRLTLHVLLSSNQRNAILVDDIGTIKSILSIRKSDRGDLAVGRPYSPPKASTRIGLDPVADAAQLAVALDPPDSDELTRLAWTSRLNVGSLKAAQDASALWNRLAGLGETEPGVAALPKGPNPYPVALPGVPHTPADSLLAAFAACEGSSEAPLDPEIESVLRRSLRHSQRRLGALNRELHDAEDPLKLRGLGDLLLARLNTIGRGSSVVSLEGFDGAPVEVPLDPTMSPRENADAFYDQAGRAARAKEALPARIAAAEAQVRRVEHALTDLGQGVAPEADWISQLRRSGKAKGTGDAPSLPYRLYRSSNGLEIWVGRGSKSNDSLTFQHARPNDVWLHARDVAGAHVVLRWDRADAPPGHDLEEAALLAALHSKARHSGLVPVDWTRRKYVRKPRKAPAGAVIPSRVKTVFVEPDAERADGMAVRD